MITDFGIGDRVLMRKKHACGGSEWEITRNGADIRIKCLSCGRSVMLDRLVFMRAAKKVTFSANGAAASIEESPKAGESDEENRNGSPC